MKVLLFLVKNYHISKKIFTVFLFAPDKMYRIKKSVVDKLNFVFHAILNAS